MHGAAKVRTRRSLKYNLMDEVKFDISGLMDKPIWQMSGNEFVKLAEFAFSKISLPAAQEPQKPQFVYGIQALAEYLGCGNSKVHSLKKDGVLDAAIISTVGKKIIFNAWLQVTLEPSFCYVFGELFGEFLLKTPSTML